MRKIWRCLIFLLKNSLKYNCCKYRFVVDNSGEVTSLDWYNARISLDFKLNLQANGSNIALADHNGILNWSSSFFKHFDFNLIVKISTSLMMQITPLILNIYLTIVRHTPKKQRVMNFSILIYQDQRKSGNFEVSGTNQLAKRRAACNKGCALRKALLGTSSTVNTEIPLSRYSFFEMLEDELLPNTRFEMNFEIESDGNLICQAGADCRVVIIRMQLYVPRITFNTE